MIWIGLHPERVSEVSASVRARAKASGKHRCATCDINLASITALSKHLNTKAHKEQVRPSQGGRPKAVSTETMRLRAFYAKNKANKKHYCSNSNMRPHRQASENQETSAQSCHGSKIERITSRCIYTDKTLNELKIKVRAIYYIYPML